MNHASGTRTKRQPSIKHQPRATRHFDTRPHTECSCHGNLGHARAKLCFVPRLRVLLLSPTHLTSHLHQTQITRSVCRERIPGGPGLVEAVVEGKDCY